MLSELEAMNVLFFSKYMVLYFVHGFIKEVVT